MTIAKNAKPSKQKTAITVALAAGALAAAGTAAPGGETPTTATPKPDSSIAPASAVLAAIATPNSLYAAGGAAQVAVLGQGSGGIPAVGAAPKVGAAGPNLFAPKFFAHPAAAPTGAGPAWSAGSFTHAALISASPGGGRLASAAPLFTSSAPAVFAVSSPALIQVNPVGAIGASASVQVSARLDYPAGPGRAALAGQSAAQAARVRAASAALVVLEAPAAQGPPAAPGRLGVPAAREITAEASD